MYYDLIKCVRCLEHLINFGCMEYNDMYNQITQILISETGLTIMELYNQIEYITPDKLNNELEAVGFFNRFITKSFKLLSDSTRQNYYKIISPLIKDICIFRDLTFTKIYSEGERLIEKYIDYEDPKIE